MYRCWDLAVLLSHLVFPHCHSVSLFQGMSVCPIMCCLGTQIIISSSFQIGALPFHWNKMVLIFWDKQTFSFIVLELQKHYHPFCTPCLIVYFSSSLRQGRMHAWHMLCSNTWVYNVIMYSTHARKGARYITTYI